ncbi:MAG: hypothetical protein LBS01_04935 [Prevotellaceae bacterium]|jgi:hypothetical protein|nr:hypothetical protein [Prevotellaceae bacterium]
MANIIPYCATSPNTSAELPVLKLSAAGYENINTPEAPYYATKLKATILNRHLFDSVTIALEQKKKKHRAYKLMEGNYRKYHTIQPGFCEPVRSHFPRFITRYDVPKSLFNEASVIIGNWQQFIGCSFNQAGKFVEFVFTQSKNRNKKYVQFRLKVLYEKNGKKGVMIGDQFRVVRNHPFGRDNYICTVHFK